VFDGTHRLRKRDFPEYFEALAYRLGFVCRRKDKDDNTLVLELDRRKEWRLSPIRKFLFSCSELPSEPADRETTALVSIRLEHSAASRACSLIRPFAPSAVEIGICGDDRTVLLQGRQPEVGVALALLQATDVAEGVEPRVITSLKLDHLLASPAAPHLSALLDGSSRRGTPGSRSPPALVFADPDQNALILCGTRDQVALAKQVITLLDQAQK
jgi:hypothetical protein